MNDSAYASINSTVSGYRSWKPMTCRKSSHKGFGYDLERNMWVCAECNKPSQHHGGYVTECLWCARTVVVWKYYEGAEFETVCADCPGGPHNVAGINQTSTDDDIVNEKYLEAD